MAWIGLETPLSVSSPSSVTASPSAVIEVELNETSGNCSASKKSGAIRWPVRLSSLTLIEAILALPDRAPSCRVAVRSSTEPRNVETTYLTAKSADEWAVAKFQLPARRSCTVAVLDMGTCSLRG